jgi:hypothetical protein
MSDLASIALGQAILKIGVKENPVGSNWGHPVQDYLHNVGVDFPASWCAAVQYTNFKEAAEILKIENPVPKTGGVLNMLRLTPKDKIFFQPQEGDLFVMDLGHGLGHTGIVEHFNAEYIYTLDGNTNDTGSREGYEFIRKQRKRSTIKCYLRF